MEMEAENAADIDTYVNAELSIKLARKDVEGGERTDKTRERDWIEGEWHILVGISCHAQGSMDV